jgi:hypothetical protein
MSPPISGPVARTKGVEGPILFAPEGLTNTGFLIVPVRDARGGWHRLTVRLTPAQMRVIALLHEAMRKDSHLPWEARGWRPFDKLAARVEQLANYRLEKHSIGAYITTIRRKVLAAAKRLPAINPPSVIERGGRLGARLAWPDLQINDGTPSPRQSRS